MLIRIRTCPTGLRAGRIATALPVLLLCVAAAYAAPDVEVEKVVSNPQPAAGQPFEFTISVRNLGPDAATDVRVVDRLPAGISIPPGLGAFPASGTYDPATGEWFVGNLGAGAGSLLLIPAIVTAAAPAACIVNTAEARVAGDANAGNDRALVAVRQPGIERCVDLRATFASIRIEPDCGRQRRFDIEVDVRNAGPDAARNVVVDLGQSPLVMPGLRFTTTGCAGLRCTLASISPGATVRLRAASDDFRNETASASSLTLAVASSDTEYAPADDELASEGTIPVFEECTGEPGSQLEAQCFIATAAYGSPLEPQVEALRGFRDRYLQPNPVGRAFIRFYYRHSPPLASFIARHEPLRFATRALLAPLVWAVVHPAWALSALALGAAAWLGRRLRLLRRRAAGGRTAQA